MPIIMRIKPEILFIISWIGSHLLWILSWVMTKVRKENHNVVAIAKYKGMNNFPINEISWLKIIENNEIKKIKAFMLKILVINPLIKLLFNSCDLSEESLLSINDEKPKKIR